MNPKYEKVCADIEKIRGKLTTWTNRLRELERLKTELENTDIVAMFRSSNISRDQLEAYIQAFQQGNPPTVPAPGNPPAASVKKTTDLEEKEIEE